MERSLPSVELLIIELKLIVCLQTRLAAELGLRVYHGYIGSSSSTSHILRFSLGSKRATTAAAASVRPIGGLSRSRPATLISESLQTALASLIPSPVTTVKRRVSLGQILDKTGPPSPTGGHRSICPVRATTSTIVARRLVPSYAPLCLLCLAQLHPLPPQPPVLRLPAARRRLIKCFIVI